jgi:hypothetical protein
VSATPSEFLAADYLAAQERLHRIEDRLLLVGAGGVLLSVGAAAYTLNFRAPLELKLGFAWALPLPFLVTAAVLLALLAWRTGARAQVDRLRRQAGLPDTSPSRAIGIIHRLLWLPGSGLAGLFGLTFLFSLRAIYTSSRVAGTSFGLVYTLLCAALGLAGWVIWREGRGQPALTLGELGQRVLPYPAELLKGAGLVAAGFAAAWLTSGLNASQLNVVNALFRRNIDFSNSLPLAAILALGLVYFLIVEGLLVPAGRMWRAYRTGEAGAAGPAPILVRTGLALLLAALVGGLPLLILAAAIALQQGVAGLAADWAPRGAAEGLTRQAAHARFELLWSGLLAPLRLYTGALVWLGPAWSFTILLLLFCAVAFLSVGIRAAQRARQARIQTVRGEEPLGYYLRDAPRWQYAGFLAAGLTAAGLLALQILAEDCAFSNPFLITVYGHCKLAGVHYSHLGLLNSLLLTFDLLLLGLFACAGVVRLMGRSGGTALLVFATRARIRAMPVMLGIALALGVACVITGQVSLGLGGLLVGVGVVALWNER